MAERAQGGQGFEREGSHLIVGVARSAGPDEADFQTVCIACIAAEALAPFDRVRSIGGEIRHVRGNVGERGAEDQRETHEGAVDIERGDRLSIDDDLGVAGDAAEEALKFGGCAEDDFGLRVLAGDQGKIADELDGVAESLLGVEKDRAAVQRRAVPAGLFEMGVGLEEGGAFPSPLEFRPAALEVAVGQERQPEIGMHFGIVRSQSGRTLKSGQGLVEASRGGESNAQVGKRVGQARRGVDGVALLPLLMGGKKLLGAAPRVAVHGADHGVVGRGEIRAKFKAAPIEAQRFIDAPKLGQQQREIVDGLMIIGAHANGLAISGDGFVETSQRAQGIAKTVVGRLVIGRQDNGLAIGFNGLMKLTLLGERDAEVEMSVGLVRRGLDDLAVELLGLFQASGLVVRQSRVQQVEAHGVES